MNLGVDRDGWGATLVAPWLVVLLLVPVGCAQAQDPVGTWNLEMRNLAERATGGVQHELLRIEEVDGELTAQMTAPNNRFLPVQSFQYEEDRGRLNVRFAVYEYDLRIDGNRVTGRMTSPVDTLEVTGSRQDTQLYAGDEAEDWVATRTGVLGHRTEGAPPEGVTDPVAWVRSRIDSVEDLALVIRGHPVAFTNAPEFEEVLETNAGQTVTARVRWVGERLELVEVEPGEN